ncbi:MAG: FixH family protein [Nitrospiraceae bacterium]|nr:FixH family protein [Nitrospiraceae bacterium]
MKALIVFVTAVALTAVIGAIVIGSRSFEGIVTKHPYETGIAWDRTRHERIESGWGVRINGESIHTGDVSLPITVTDRENHALTGAAVTVTLSRPASAAYDATYAAVESVPGIYTAAARFPLYGYWDVKITVSHDKKRVSFDKRLYITKQGES